jgi:hypothetical protein
MEDAHLLQHLEGAHGGFKVAVVEVQHGTAQKKKDAGRCVRARSVR